MLFRSAARKLIVRYQNETGLFIWIPGFAKHQTPHYSEKPSGIKPPPLQERDGNERKAAPRTTQEDSENLVSSRGGRNPLNPDSLNPSSPNPESRLPDQGGSSGLFPEIPREGQEPEPAKTAAKRRTQLPPDFDLTPERRGRLRQHAPNADAGLEFGKFCDHHRSRGNTMADWEAAWGTWCRNAATFSRPVVRTAERESTLDHNRRAAEEFIRGTA